MFVIIVKYIKPLEQVDLDFATFNCLTQAA
jgi:hypothetical protein